MALTARRRTWTAAIKDPRQRLLLALEEGVATLDLSVKIVNALEAEGIITVNDLLHCRRSRLLEIPNFGGKALGEVFHALALVGFQVPGDWQMAKKKKAKVAGSKSVRKSTAAESSKVAAATSKDKLSAVDTLAKVIEGLTGMQTFLETVGEYDDILAQINWVLDLAVNRQVPTVDESADESEVVGQAEDVVEEEEAEVADAPAAAETEEEEEEEEAA